MDSKAEQEENGRGRLVDCVLKVSLWLIVRTFPPSPSPHPLLLSLLLCLISTPSRLSPPSKKVFPPPDLHQEALNHRRPLLSQPPIQPRKVCLRMCVWLCVFMCVCAHQQMCTEEIVYFAYACCFAVHVCYMATQQGARGASQGKWVFVKRKARKGTPNMPPGRKDRSTLALSHTHTHSAWCTTSVLLLRSHRENRELCTYWTEPRESGYWLLPQLQKRDYWALDSITLLWETQTHILMRKWMHRDTRKHKKHTTLCSIYIQLSKHLINLKTSFFLSSINLSSFIDSLSLFPSPTLWSLQVSNEITAVLTHFSASFMKYLLRLLSARVPSHTPARTHKLHRRIFLKIESNVFCSTVASSAVHHLLSFWGRGADRWKDTLADSSVLVRARATISSSLSFCTSATAAAKVRLRKKDGWQII